MGEFEAAMADAVAAARQRAHRELRAAAQASLGERARAIGFEIEQLAPRRGMLAASVDFRPLIDHNAGDVVMDRTLRLPDEYPPPSWSAPDVAMARQLREARTSVVVWPEPWLSCPGCRLEGWHLIEHRPSPAGAQTSWPDPAAPHWLRTCVWCWHEWREPA